MVQLADLRDLLKRVTSNLCAPFRPRNRVLFDVLTWKGNPNRRPQRPIHKCGSIKWHVQSGENESNDILYKQSFDYL